MAEFRSRYKSGNLGINSLLLQNYSVLEDQYCVPLMKVTYGYNIHDRGYLPNDRNYIFLPCALTKR